MIMVIPGNQPIFKIDNTPTGLVLKKRDPATGAFSALAWANVDGETGEWTHGYEVDGVDFFLHSTDDPDEAVSILWDWRFGFSDRHHPFCECPAGGRRVGPRRGDRGAGMIRVKVDTKICKIGVAVCHACGRESQNINMWSTSPPTLRIAGWLDAHPDQ